MKPFMTGLAAAATLAVALPAAAQFQKPEDAVKYRQSTMFVQATHFGRIGAMVQGRAPYDAAAALANAEVVSTMSRLHWVAFADSAAGAARTRAKANIWTERAKFDEAGRKMTDEVAKLVTAARSNNLDNVKAVFGGVAQACKACHDDFQSQ
jgi:cytochrome c556